MKNPMRQATLSAFLGMALVLGPGCSREQEDSWADMPAEEETDETYADTGYEESTTDAFVIGGDGSPASPEQYESAMRAQNYVQAADVILRMNAQGRQDGNEIDRMRQLQMEVANAMANGDPQAQRAAEMLRRIGRMPPPTGR
ncbi:MAG: hypothetical protein KF833_09510 [Verrucomicrobiae bacterium]|nr:hypothetical protein [Verrucomicrobiae bacterium]